MPFTFDKAELDRYAAGLARNDAADLHGALGWFGAHEEEPTVTVSLHDLQQFVHYRLPRKVIAGVEEHVAIARTLGDALKHLGAPAAYSELCTSQETLDLLRLWAVDEDAAFGRFAALTRASGLEPPDVKEFEWHGVMGIAEARAREAATLALEHALESGDARPAAEIVRAVLAEPDPESDGFTRLEAVQAERVEHWAGWRDSARARLLKPLVDELTAAQVPEWPADDVFDWLLDEAQEGLALTERGALSRAIVTEVAQRRPEWTWGKPPRSEADLDHLERLHTVLRGSGLVRRRGRKLLATKRAQALAPAQRRIHLLTSMLDADSFHASVAELTLAALARGVDDVAATVAEVIEAEGWRTDDGPLPSYAVPSTVTDVCFVLLAIGAAEGDPMSLRKRCTLAESGRELVLVTLRARALNRQPSPPSFPETEPPPDDFIAERVAAALPPVPGGAPPHLDPADEDDRAELIRLAHPDMAAAIDAGMEVMLTGGAAVNPRLHLLMHEVVANRLLYDDPPEDWAAFEALLASGVDPHDAQHATGQRIVEEMVEAVGPPPPPARRERDHSDRSARRRRKAQRAARRRNRR